MDLNDDGKIDILSGCYAHDANKEGMAGLFSVFWGQKGRSWKRPEVLNGSDGEPLIITAGGQDPDIDRICTRPTAVDLDGDGKLDIVSGNFRGTFAFFAGQGKGKFAEKSTLLMADGAPLAVNSHSDPSFVDWDRDGDLDLVTGSAHGGVFLCENSGSAKEPKFQKPRTLLEVAKRESGKLGDEHLTGPLDDSRVCVDDVNDDGKFDLLVGDNVSLVQPGKGVAPAVAAAKFRDFEAKRGELVSRRPAEGAAEAAMKKFDDEFEKLRKDVEKFVSFERTGFVWVLYQKSPAPVTGTR
ncbi:MAG TPA: VCBS repeat-containing protein [Planctomycetota bacterium]|nr:VCBS repeat-containing protein [Planctomycetota bacterium]